MLYIKRKFGMIANDTTLNLRPNEIENTVKKSEYQYKGMWSTALSQTKNPRDTLICICTAKLYSSYKKKDVV